MNADSFDSLSPRIGLTLVHSVWQFAAIALGLAVLLAALRHRSAAFRYIVECFALALMVIAAIATFCIVETRGNAAPTGGEVALEEVGKEPAVGSVSSNGFNPHVSGSMATPPSPLLQERDESVSATKGLQPGSPVGGWSDRVRRWQAIALDAADPWLSELCNLWLIGMTMLSSRLVLGWYGVRRLRRMSNSGVASDVVDIVRRLSGPLGVTKAVCVAQSSLVEVPSVIGWLRPLILLPMSSLTGLSREQLEAVIAHELAHIRRHDYLVNALQMVLETVFFYHPALWWVSHRMRIEREECCDDLAVAVTGDRVGYARLLLWLDESRPRSKSSTAALAASGGSLVQRIRRLVRPTSSQNHGAGMIVVAFWLALLAGGSIWIHVILRDDAHAGQRDDDVREIGEMKTESPATESDDQRDNEAPASVSGRILLPDGELAAIKGQLVYDSRRDGSSSSGNLDHDGGRFETEVPAGKVVLSYFANGYAPAWTQPMDIKPGEVRDQIEIRLSKGFNAKVRVRSSDGKPIAGATIVALPEINGSVGGTVVEHQTNERGELTLHHVASTRYSFRAEASGFQILRTPPLAVMSETPVVLELENATPTTGRVLTADGKPAVGARFRVKFEVDAEGSSIRRNDGGGFYGEMVAVTDDKGNFVLDSLSDDTRYLFIIEATDGARSLHRGLRSGQSDLEIRLPERRDIVIHLRGDLSEFFGDGSKRSADIRQSIVMKTETQAIGDLVGDTVLIDPNPTGGTIRYQGLVVDPEKQSGEQTVQVSFGTKERKSWRLQWGTQRLTSYSMQVNPIDQPEILFSSARRRSLKSDSGDQSAIIFYSDEHVHFVLLHDGFLQTGLTYREYSNIQDGPSLWNFNGELNAFSGRQFTGDPNKRWQYKRTYALKFDYSPPELTIRIDGQSIDLGKGRLLTLQRSGPPQQNSAELPALNELDMDSLLTLNDPKANSDEGAATQRPQPADNTGIERQEAAVPDQSLVVRLVDKDSEPVSGVKLRLFDGRNVWSGRQAEYPMQMAVTDAQGRAVFADLFNLIPKDSGYWIEFFKPEDSKLRYPKRLVGGGKSLVSSHRADPLIRTTETATSVTYTLTLREECPTDIRIVDADDRPIHMAHLMFRDDRVADWTLAGLQDYGESNADPTEIVLHHYTTFVPEMSDAKFVAIREGYYPVEFTLPEDLRPDKRVRKKVVLRRAPPIRLSVQEADGAPAAGAKLTYVGPTPRGPYFPVKLAGSDGTIQLKYPAWGDQARYKLAHKGTEVQVEAKAWLSGQPERDPTKPIEAMTRLPASRAAKRP